MASRHGPRRGAPSGSVWRVAVLAAALAPAGSCRCGGPGTTDAGTTDGGGLDGGTDAGAVDSGDGDAGRTDAAKLDAGAPDAAAAESGVADSGPADSGAPDGGAIDAGTDGAVAADGGAATDGGAPLTCVSCHGAGTEPAPPVDTLGNSDISFTTVGAHRAHLGLASWHRTGVCADCHVVPVAIADPGHIDPAPAELTWGAVATAETVAPVWSADTCVVYCHGATRTGGTLTTPDWTLPDQAYCGACHGVPPPAPHPAAGLSCAGCHPFTGLWPDDPERHIDGILDLTVSCTSCHGDPAAGPAPPVDTSGDTATTATGVGAHQSHLATSTWHATVQCTDCHVYPTGVGDASHLDGDGTAELTFSALAAADGASPGWNGTSCSGVYCHGETLSGGSETSPTWTAVDGSQDACGTCHGLPPTSGHPGGTVCSACHGMVIDASGAFVAPELHVNGTVDVDATIACGSCHDVPPSGGSHFVHAGMASPAYGGLQTAADLGIADQYAFGCGFCHPLDPSHHMNGGLAEIELYDPAAPPGSLKALNPPSAGYVVGTTVVTDAFGLDYTIGGTCADVYCHSGMDTASSAVPVPGVDFPFAGYPILYPPYTVTRTRLYESPAWGVSVLSCAGCHGYPPRAFFPGVEAAAGESHSFIDPYGWEDMHMWNHGYDPLSCRTCHWDTVGDPTPFSRDAMGVAILTDVAIGGYDRHVDGDVDVIFDTFDPLPYTGPIDLSTAAWDPAAKTCSNVDCHRLQASVSFGSPYRFDNGAECNSCHQL